MDESYKEDMETNIREMTRQHLERRFESTNQLVGRLENRIEVLEQELRQEREARARERQEWRGLLEFYNIERQGLLRRVEELEAANVVLQNQVRYFRSLPFDEIGAPDAMIDYFGNMQQVAQQMPAIHPHIFKKKNNTNLLRQEDEENQVQLREVGEGDQHQEHREIEVPLNEERPEIEPVMRGRVVLDRFFSPQRQPVNEEDRARLYSTPKAKPRLSNTKSLSSPIIKKFEKLTLVDQNPFPKMQQPSQSQKRLSKIRKQPLQLQQQPSQTQQLAQQPRQLTPQPQHRQLTQQAQQPQPQLQHQQQRALQPPSHQRPIVRRMQTPISAEKMKTRRKNSKDGKNAKQVWR